MATSRSADVLVLGGGPAGSVAARAMADAGADVVLAERSGYDRPRVGETLPPEASSLLGRLGPGLLDAATHVVSPGTVAAWGGGAPHANDFLFSPYGSGWHLDRRRFDESLALAAADAGAELITSARPVECRRRASGAWGVVLATGRGAVDVTARRVIDATGRSAWFSRRAGASRRAFDRLVGVIGVFDDPGRPDPRTFIEAAPDGWWYVSPLPARRAIAIFFTDADLEKARPGASGSRWDARLASAPLAADRLATARRVGGLRVVSAASTLADHVAGDGWLAVGDAACTLDPLSSQGIGWAIVSGLEAARATLDPDPAAAAGGYTAGLFDRYRDYLDTRRAYYGAERRWPESPFSARRAAGPLPEP